MSRSSTLFRTVLLLLLIGAAVGCGRRDVPDASNQPALMAPATAALSLPSVEVATPPTVTPPPLPTTQPLPETLTAVARIPPIEALPTFPTFTSAALDLRSPPTNGQSSRVVFNYYGEMYLINADGSGLINVSERLPTKGTFPSIHYLQNLTWSPDGQWIVGNEYVGSNTFLCVTPVDDVAALHCVTSLRGQASTDQCPTWSPDSHQIAFWSYHWGMPETPDADAAIVVIDRDGNNPRRVTTNLATDFHWAGDFSGCTAWSPDGQWIAFHSNGLYVIRPDGSDLKRLTSTGTPDYPPSWSPDSQQIAFVARQGDNDEIFVIRPDGTGLRRLTSTQARNYMPAWSPDGQQIAFVSERDNSSVIYVMRADGSQQTALVAVPRTRMTQPITKGVFSIRWIR